MRAFLANENVFYDPTTTASYSKWIPLFIANHQLLAGGLMINLALTGDFPTALVPKLTEFSVLREQHDFSRSSIKRLLCEAEAYVLGGPEYLDAELLAGARKLKLIVVLGTGTSSFLDEESARLLGVAVQNTPHLNCDVVADFARQIVEIEASGVLQSIEGLKSRRSWNQEIRKATGSLKIGIIGGGPTAGALMRELKKHGFQPVLYSSRSEKTEFGTKFDAVFCSAESVFQHADIVSIHYRFSETDEGMLDHLLKLGRGQVKVLNFSNPYLFTSGAVKAALTQGWIKSFFLDGYYGRNVPDFTTWNDPEGLIDLPGFRASSHIAALEESCIRTQLSSAFSKVTKFFEGTK